MKREAGGLGVFLLCPLGFVSNAVLTLTDKGVSIGRYNGPLWKKIHWAVITAT